MPKVFNLLSPRTPWRLFYICKYAEKRQLLLWNGLLDDNHGYSPLWTTLLKGLLSDRESVGKETHET